MAGLAEPDAGERFVQPGRTVAYLPQDPDPTGFATLLDYAAADLAADERWRAEAALEGLKVAGGTDPGTASGGERRRAALARLIAAGADLCCSTSRPTISTSRRSSGWRSIWPRAAPRSS